MRAQRPRLRTGGVQYVEAGGHPPIGGKVGTKGEWTISDLVLPVPGDIRRMCFVCSFYVLLSLSSFFTGNARYPPRPYQSGS
jgi:hypothetical protein